MNVNDVGSGSLLSPGALALEPILALNTPVTGLTSDGLGSVWVIITFTGLPASVATSVGMHIGIHAELVAAILFG